MAGSSSAFSSLVGEALTGNNREELKNENKKALLEQQSNVQEYKKKLGSYRARMGAQGAANLSTGVQEGLEDETNQANSLIARDLRDKIKKSKRSNRQKTLLSLGVDVDIS